MKFCSYYPVYVAWIPLRTSFSAGCDPSISTKLIKKKLNWCIITTLNALNIPKFMVTAYLYNLNNFADGWPSYKKRFQRFHNCLRFSWAWCYLDSLLLLLCAVIIELCSSISRYHSAGGRVVYLAVHCVLLKDNWSKIENLNIGRLKDWFGQGWRIQEEKRI